MDEDTDPTEPARGTPTHPIEISDGSSFHGAPYQGPDSFMALFNQHEWYHTPQSSQQPQHPRDPSEDPHFVAVTPPPPPPAQPVMPDPPRRRRTNARMSTRGGGDFHFSTPRHSSSSHYPPLQEEGPSSPVQEANSAPAAPTSPPFGYDHPIPAYTGPTTYNPFEPSSQAHYNTTTMSATHMWCWPGIMHDIPTELMGTWEHRTTQLMGIQHLPDLQFRNRRHNHVSLLPNKKKYSTV
ncbi:hypothetical protein HanIR_Chr15g0771001 [Helianthus annuus]|nr:hypothetical protein HanIR_Chr15g0771001 [Helianthus annuus]